MALLPLITTILSFFTASFLAQHVVGKLITPETDAYINSILERWNSTGLAIAIVRKDQSAPNGWYHEFGSYGIANAQGDLVTPDTIFGIASNSKLFLSISVGLLIENSTLREERGQELEWTTKAKDVYGDLWGMWDDEISRGVNLQDMVSHRTGMPRHDSSYTGALGDGSVANMISTFRYLRPSVEFRQTFQYNNMMYGTLSYLPTLLLNQTYESYIEQHIFNPLNMTSSTYDVDKAEKSGNLADGFQYHLRDLTKGINGTRKATVPYFSRPGEEKIWAGAGGVLTSARDLTMWISMLLDNGKHPYTNEQIIPAKIVEHVATGVTVRTAKAEFPELSAVVYGAGQMRYSYRGRELIEHGGSNPGFKTQVTRFPNDNLGIIVLSNDEQGKSIMDVVKWRIVDDILFVGQQPIDWNQRYEEAWANRTRDAQEKITPRPSSPKRPSFPFETMAQRTYSHPAYGSFQPCLVPSSSLSSSPQTFDKKFQYEQSEGCSTILSSLTARRIMDVSDLTIPTFIVSLPRFLMTHFRIQHFDGNLFNVSVIWSNAEVRQREGLSTSRWNHNVDLTTMEYREPGRQVTLHTALTIDSCLPSDSEDDDGDVLVDLDEHFEIEWVVDGDEEGLAFKGGFWGAEGLGTNSLKGKGKESAEVWFASQG